MPEFQVCEHLPLLAQRVNQFANLRTLSHRGSNHLMSTHHVLIGTKKPAGCFAKVASRDDWPNYAGACEYLRMHQRGLSSRQDISRASLRVESSVKGIAADPILDGRSEWANTHVQY